MASISSRRFSLHRIRRRRRAHDERHGCLHLVGYLVPRRSWASLAGRCESRRSGGFRTTG